jgi:hypothetical protein
VVVVVVGSADTVVSVVVVPEEGLDVEPPVPTVVVVAGGPVVEGAVEVGTQRGVWPNP